MFRSAANPILRLVLGPILLLWYLLYQGAPLPILAPVFVVIFLTLMPSKPPLGLLIKLLVVLLFVSFGLVLLGQLLLDSPFGYGLFVWSLVCWSFYRSHKDPKDILSTLVLIVVIIMTVMTKQFGTPIDGLPWLLFAAFIIALVITYVCFILFPGDEQDILPDENQIIGVAVPLTTIVFKASIMCVVLAVFIVLGGSQTILIAITLANMIKIPSPHEHSIYSKNRIITTVIGILFTLPVMLLSALGASGWLLCGAAIACGLQLACYAIARQARMSIYQLLFTNFTVLIYQIITHQGIDSFSAQLLRLESIIIAIILGAVVLNLTAQPIMPSEPDAGSIKQNG